MRIAEFSIKMLAVLLILAATVCAYGRELVINAFVENKTEEKTVLSKSITEEAAPLSEVERKVMQKNKSAVVSDGYSDMPFLVKNIKYNCLYGDGVAVFYNSNQKMVYDIEREICIEFLYNCSIGVSKLSEEECVTEMRRAVYRAFSHKGIRISKVNSVSDDEKTFTALIEIEGCLNERMIMSVRKDTGSVIYFKIYDAPVE